MVLLFICLGLSGVSFAAAVPLTTRDVSLMLRSGYSSTTVMQELSKRHFADTFDAEKESALLKAGASAELVSTLKGGLYAASPKESALMQEQIARQNVRSSVQSERARQTDADFQAQVIRERSSRTVPTTGSNVLYESVKGDLVRCTNGSVAPAEDQGIAGKKLIALYFSAHWCPPCRKFTPELVDFYNRVAPQHPEFEIIFVSCDRSADAMETYMHETNMPWPAIDFAKVAGKDVIRKYCGKGIPCLVLLDANGRVLSDTYAGTEYLGPQKVLADINATLTGPAPHVAQSR